MRSARWLLLLALTGCGADPSATDFREEARLRASDGHAEQYLGYTVSVSGGTLVAGTVDVPDDREAGRAYVFVRAGTGWVEQQALAGSDTVPGDRFGVSVAIDGDTVVVGAMSWHQDQGAAYVFVRSGVTWTEQQKLVASDGRLFNSFGHSVAISGDTVLVGADLWSEKRGAAYVFTRSGGVWTEQQRLVASGAGPVQFFGIELALSGNTAVVVSASTDVAAYVFERSGTAWTERQRLVPTDAGPADVVSGLAVSGDTILVGSATRVGSGSRSRLEGPGWAYVYVRAADGSWTKQQKLVDPEGDALAFFGSAATILGHTIVVGAPRADTRAGAEAGAVHVFARSGAGWSHQRKLTASDGAAGDRFGNFLALSADSLVVSAIADDTPDGPDAGSLYVFRSSN